MVKIPNNLIRANYGKLVVKAGLMTSSILEQFCPCHVLQFLMLQEIFAGCISLNLYIVGLKKEERPELVCRCALCS